MSPLNNNQRLDNSTGIGQDNPNETMQPASQTKKTPWFLRIQEALNLRGLARAVGLGFLCGEPTENTQPEKKTPLKRQGIGAKAIIAILAVTTVLAPISAMAAGKIVVFIIGWGAGQVLTESKEALKKKLLSAKKATASVNGAYWVSNSYSGTSTEGDDVASNDAAIWLLGPRWSNIQVSQGHEVDDDPSGTENGVAMSEERAEAYMEEQGWYAKIYFYGYAVNEDKHEVIVTVVARGDKFSEVKKETLAALREERDDDTYEWDNDLWTKNTYIRKVGNHKMVSKFNDPNVPKVEELATPGPTSTKYYWGTVSWTKYPIDRLGNKGPGEADKRRVRFRSYRESPRRRQLCRINQIIEDQHINESITRQIERRKKQIYNPNNGLINSWRTGGPNGPWITTNWLNVVHID